MCVLLCVCLCSCVVENVKRDNADQHSMYPLNVITKTTKEYWELIQVYIVILLDQEEDEQLTSLQNTCYPTLHRA